MSSNATHSAGGTGIGAGLRQERALRRLLRDKIAVATGLVLAFMVAAACAPWVPP
jgi:hypothetical protein